MLFVISVGFGLGAALMSRGEDVGSPAAQSMFAVFAAWPLFVGLLRWRASVEFRRLQATDGIQRFIRADDLAEQEEQRPFDWDSENVQSFRTGFNSGTKQEGGWVAIIILIAVSIGTWLIYDLIRRGPTLLTGAIIDGAMARDQPHLLLRFPVQHWLKEAVGGTLLHFCGIAVVAGFLVGFFALHYRV